jgi:hypothetical protein
MENTSPIPEAPSRPGGGFVNQPADPEEIGRVEDVVRTLAKTVRAHQLYEGRSPSYDRFVTTLQDTLVLLWESLPALVLDFEENRVVWEAHEVYRGEQRSESLAFLFFRDGIRQLVLLPGFEKEELARVLGLLAQVHRVREDQDDLVTMLWEADFDFVRYRTLELAMEGLELPQRSGSEVPTVDPGMLRAELSRESGWRSDPLGPPDSGPELSLVFQEALHVLEPAELSRLAEDLRREHARDLWADIVNGLVDRLEDATAERQRRIVTILTEFLPGLISAGHIRAASLILRELNVFAARAEHPSDAGRAETEALFSRLSEAGTIAELIRSVEDAPDAFPIEEFSDLLQYFPTAALGPLIGGVEAVVRPDIRDALESAIGSLAAREPGHVASLLGSNEPALLCGALRLVGRLGITGAAGDVARLLGRPEPQIRLGAIAAVQELRVATAAGALQNLLADPERDVRIAAARALGALRYPAARSRLEALLGSRRMREADVTERIAVFEAFGSVAGIDGIPVLDRLLNGRGWLGRKETSGVRAAAALSLGRISHASAAEVLTRAANDADPVVRTAVSRSLRPGAS